MSTESGNPGACASALSVDNSSTKDILVDTKVEGKNIVTSVECDSIRTLLATLDDLICCQMVSESVIQDG